MAKKPAKDELFDGALSPGPPAPAAQIPSPGSPDWTPWVLSKLEPYEVFDGHPTVAGLRRFCRDGFGVPVESVTRVVQGPTPNNEGRAAAEHHLAVVVYDQVPVFGGLTLKASGAADAHEENINGSMAKPYPLAVAETRAEGRAYVRLLGLNVCTKEEIGRPLPEESDTEEGRWAAPAQLLLIDSVCRRMDINPVKFLSLGKKPFKPGDKLPFAKAQEAFGRLSELSNRANNKKLEAEDGALLERVRGYDAAWRGA